MLKKFVLWFICFGLSFLVSEVFGWAKQGEAFIYISLGANIIIVLIFIAILIVSNPPINNSENTGQISFFMLLSTVVPLAIILFTTWIATQLFDIDFFVAYQIMTFGQCLCSNSEKKSD